MRHPKNRNELLAKLSLEVINRDHGCVFCQLGYRPERHVPCTEYDVHFYGQDFQPYASCAYHQMIYASLKNRKAAGALRDPQDIKELEEMESLLSKYLKRHPEPEVF